MHILRTAPERTGVGVERAPFVLPGLSNEEALRRLRAFGSNELPRAPRQGMAGILFDVLREPMFLLLMVAAAIYLAVGGIGEGLLMVAFAGLSTTLVVLQETRSENALEALRSLSAPMARVVRDGSEVRIPAREVVPGDTLLVADGERVAADSILRCAEGLSLDESLLTGESVPVPKRALARDDIAHGACDEDGSTHLFASTLVVSGRGVAEVVATGSRTEVGRIGASLASIETEPTLLQRSLGRLVRWFGLIALFASGWVILLYGWLRGAWLDGVLSGIAFGMAALPEEFPMVLAVFVALGAQRLARLGVLVRRTAVIEVLGACSALCLDKTGTLTENRMRICALAADHEHVALDSEDAPPSAFAGLARIAALASAFRSNDPMDQAVHRLAAAYGDVPDAGAQRIKEFGLTHERPVVVHIWRIGNRIEAAAKGAPEAIGALCGLEHTEQDELLRETVRHAAAGCRVLAVASALVDGSSPLPETPEKLGLELRGLLVFADPPRQGARAAIAAARRAGVSVFMITGDHPATANAIAHEVGIDTANPPVTGTQIDTVDDAGLRRLVRSARVFARIRPEQKLRIVRALKESGEIVAMTGDGVNDAPALKAAHIGLAMGQRGTDVAREAASIVLMDDDLAHLVAGIETGRRIFDNLRKAMIYITAVHVPIAGLTLLPLLLGLPPLLLPTHVVLIEMVIDPICAIAFENEPIEPGTMEQSPRHPDDPPMGGLQMLIAFAQGTLLLVAAFGLYVVALAAGSPVDTARTPAFIAFAVGNLALIRVVGTRGWTMPGLAEPGHRAYWVVVGIAGMATTACVLVPPLRRLFQFAVPTAGAAGWAVAAGILSTLVFDLVKSIPGVQKILGRRRQVSIE
ncbi:cation-translocating P-type ATPase [Dokdonella sp.]|uniref:cation-translocating P-type ATPase n=1 Tax=Dokdonella sp. TaxID=2291710 RepID=UPI002609541A|nr:cation-translocating P-type ATPase [Dokdonella sp.]